MVSAVSDSTNEKFPFSVAPTFFIRRGTGIRIITLPPLSLKAHNRTMAFPPRDDETLGQFFFFV